MSKESLHQSNEPVISHEGRKIVGTVLAGLALATSVGLIGATVHDFTDGPISSFDSNSMLNDRMPSTSK